MHIIIGMIVLGLMFHQLNAWEKEREADRRIERMFAEPSIGNNPFPWGALIKLIFWLLVLMLIFGWIILGHL